MSSNEKDIERGPSAADFAYQETYPTTSGHPSMMINEVPLSSAPSQTFAQYQQPSHFSAYRPEPAANQKQMPSMLSTFRYHVGIHADPSLVLDPVPTPAMEEAANAKSQSTLSKIVKFVTSPSSINTIMNPNSPLSRPAPNIGIFRRIVASEENYKSQYKTYAILINGALGLQLIFAAALTALGAGDGPHGAITVFGAMNTVIAGLPTFLKGSGLPNRLKYYENEWRKLREYIEQRERDLASDEHTGGRQISYEQLMEEIQNIERMYESVRQDIEANTPDSYVSMSNALKGNNGGFGGNSNNNTAHGSALSSGFHKGLGLLKDKLGGHMETAGHSRDDVLQRTHDMDSRVHQTLDSGNKQLHGIRGNFERGMSDLEKAATHNVHEIVDDARDRARDAERHAERHAESHLRDSQRQVESRFSDARTAAEGGAARASEAGHNFADRAREFEDRIALAAEKAAEKVLQMTRERERQSHKHEGEGS